MSIEAMNERRLSVLAAQTFSVITDSPGLAGGASTAPPLFAVT
jgi:hypothetical protein